MITFYHKYINFSEFDPTQGPNVDAALSVSPTQAKVEPRKSTITGRKPASAKKTVSILKYSDK